MRTVNDVIFDQELVSRGPMQVTWKLAMSMGFMSKCFLKSLDRLMKLDSEFECTFLGLPEGGPTRCSERTH